MSSITGSWHNCEQGQPKPQLGGRHNNETRGGAGKATTTGSTPTGGAGGIPWGGGEGGCGSPASYIHVCIHACMHTYICTCMYTHSHVKTCIQYLYQIHARLPTGPWRARGGRARGL